MAAEHPVAARLADGQPDEQETNAAPEATTLVAAAEQFLRLPELDTTPERLAAVREEIDRTRTWVPDAREFRWGTKIAWRSHAKCVGRKPWRALEVVDRRTILTAEQVFAGCVNHLRYATRVGSHRGKLRPVCTTFAPDTPDQPGPMIWNDQLIRYAGYRLPSGQVIGDPQNVALTDAITALGWSGRGGRFDVLPLVIETADEGPQWFELPKDTVLEVDIRHPTLPWFANLHLKWHAVPAIANMPLMMGGLSFPASVFSGWYVDGELLRNLGDPDRYDMLPVIAERLGLDIRRGGTPWRDRAAMELIEAILHSYRQAGVSIVDHHTAAAQFHDFERSETEAGRMVSADRDWIVLYVNPHLDATWDGVYNDLGLTPNFIRRGDHSCPRRR